MLRGGVAFLNSIQTLLQNLSPKKPTAILVFVLLAILFSQTIFSMKVKSPTYDEPSHLISGHLALSKRYFHLGAEHPPLIKSLAAFPLLFTDIPTPDTTEKLSRENWFLFGEKLLYQPENNVDQIVFLGRLPIVFLSALLGFYVFLWARNTYGEKSGLLALLLYVFSPNILAHSRLVTTDLGSTCFLFIASYHFRNYLVAPSTRKLLLAGFILGLALTSKFSALALFPIFFSLLCLNFYFSRNSSSHNNLKSVWKTEKTAMTILKDLSVFFGSIILVIFLVYQFRSNSLLLYMDGVESLKELYFSNWRDNDHYLWGTFYPKPVWFYSLLVFLLKTPVPVLIILVMALGSVKRNVSISINMFCLIIPVIVILAGSFFDVAHMGLRRILPIYPFLFVLASTVVSDSRSFEFNALKKSVYSVSLAILIIWHVVTSIKTYPDYLTYFNDFVVPPQAGINYLDGSNIDWGQDLKGLKNFMDQEGIKNIKLLYYGSADPQYYKIDAIPLTPDDIKRGPHSGYYAISAHLLIRARKFPSLVGLGDAWKKEHEPLRIIGNTIYVYKF